MFGCSLFLLQNRFLALVLPNLNRSGLDKILHTLVVLWNTLVHRLRPWLAPPGQTRTTMFL